MNELEPVVGIRLNVELELPVEEEYINYDGFPVMYKTVFPDGHLAWVQLIQDNRDQRVIRQIVIPMTQELLDKILSNKIALLEAFECDTCYIVDTTYEGLQVGVWSVKWENVNKNLLPKPGIKLARKD